MINVFREAALQNYYIYNDIVSESKYLIYRKEHPLDADFEKTFVDIAN
jgi:hypothetical protein